MSDLQARVDHLEQAVLALGTAVFEHDGHDFHGNQWTDIASVLGVDTKDLKKDKKDKGGKDKDKGKGKGPSVKDVASVLGLDLGDVSGHDFHGNQYTSGSEGERPASVHDIGVPGLQARMQAAREWGPPEKYDVVKAKLDAAGAVWNPNLKLHELPDGSSIRSDTSYAEPNYGGEQVRYSVFPPGTGYWTTDQGKVRRYGNLDDALASVSRG